MEDKFDMIENALCSLVIGVVICFVLFEIIL